MRRAALALALVGLQPATAAARPPEALACALQAAPPGLEARVADVIVSRDNDAGRATLDELRAVTDQCASDQFLTPRQRDAYFMYVLGRMGRDVIDARLAAIGLPATLIDQALDIGPDNANNPADKVTQGDLRRVADAMAAAGHDPHAIPAGGWALITAWIVATANMFDALRDLD